MTTRSPRLLIPELKASLKELWVSFVFLTFFLLILKWTLCCDSKQFFTATETLQTQALAQTHLNLSRKSLACRYGLFLEFSLYLMDHVLFERPNDRFWWPLIFRKCQEHGSTPPFVTFLKIWGLQSPSKVSSRIRISWTISPEVETNKTSNFKDSVLDELLPLFLFTINPIEDHYGVQPTTTFCRFTECLRGQKLHTSPILQV